MVRLSAWMGLNASFVRLVCIHIHSIVVHRVENEVRRYLDKSWHFLPTSTLVFLVLLCMKLLVHQAAISLVPADSAFHPRACCEAGALGGDGLQ